MDIELKYGDGKARIPIPEKADVSILQPLRLPVLESLEDSLKAALNSPLGCDALVKLLERRTPATVAIAIPDETRPTPSKALLVPLLELIRSHQKTRPAPAVTILIGGGLHPPADQAAIHRLLPPDIVAGCRVVAHDARTARMMDYGVTSRGTPVRINADFGLADFKIVVGQVDPHQFVGFTGGSKAAVIGCASAETIEKNHSLMSAADARVGRLRGNPVREDLNEAGEMVGIDFAVNLVLDADKKAVHLAAGKPMAVLESCAATCAEVYGVGIAEKFDIVVASCGGYPKDICLYQAQKGLNLASHAAQARRPHPAAGGLPAGGGRRYLFRLRFPVHHAGGGDPGFQVDRLPHGGPQGLSLRANPGQLQRGRVFRPGPGGAAQMPFEGGGPGNDRRRVGRSLRRHTAAGDNTECQHDLFL